MSDSDRGDDFEGWLRDKLKEAAEEIEPHEVLPEIWAKIKGGTVAEYFVRITELENSPEDWPIKSIELIVEADTEDEAEELGDSIINLILAWRKVQNAMAIEEVYES